MDSNFHDEERRPRTVLRAIRQALQDKEADNVQRRRVLGSVVRALAPFPEARQAVVEGLRATLKIPA